MHLASMVHSVICPFCTKLEQKFKRVSDVKVHARKHHQEQMEDLPAELFSDINGFFYNRLIKPTIREHKAAVQIRILVLDWTRAMGIKAGISRKDFLENWKAIEEAVPLTCRRNQSKPWTTLTSRRTPPSYSPALFPGVVFANVSRGSERFRLIISDDLFTDVHVNALRSLTRRSESLAPDSLPFAGFRRVQDVAENRRDYFAKFLGVPENVMQKDLREVEGRALEQPRIATFPKPAVSEPRPAPLSTPASACPPWSLVDLAIQVGAVPTFPATKASTVLIPATVTASARPSTEPSSTTTAPLFDITPA